jgi:hypothetical protein
MGLQLAFLHTCFEKVRVDVAIIEHLQYPTESYVFLTSRSGHRARLRDTYSSIEHINLLWLRNDHWDRGGLDAPQVCICWLSRLRSAWKRA